MKAGQQVTADQPLPVGSDPQTVSHTERLNSTSRPVKRCWNQHGFALKHRMLRGVLIGVWWWWKQPAMAGVRAIGGGSFVQCGGGGNRPWRGCVPSVAAVSFRRCSESTLAVGETVIWWHPPCTFIRCFNRDKQGGVIKMTVSPTARPPCSSRTSWPPRSRWPVPFVPLSSLLHSRPSFVGISTET